MKIVNSISGGESSGYITMNPHFHQPKLTDSSPMPFGKKYIGVKLANVPAEYLIWCYEQATIPENLREYIKDNLFILRQEIKK